MKFRSTAKIVGLVIAILSFAANATMYERLEGRALYDTEADLTWYLTGGFGSRAFVNSWANNLVVAGIDNWSLPTGDVACGFANPCLDTQYGSLFTALGGTVGTTLADQHNNFYGMFTTWWDPNGLGTGPYFTKEWFTNNAGTYAVTYNFNEPSQGFTAPGNNIVGLAVYQGDVNLVPIPAAAWLFGSGLLSLIGVARRKKA